MYQANVYMKSKSWVARWHRFCYTCFNSLNKVFTVCELSRIFQISRYFACGCPLFEKMFTRPIHDKQTAVQIWTFDSNHATNINPQLTTSKVTENKEQRLANWVSAQPSVQEKSQFQFPAVISKSLF